MLIEHRRKRRRGEEAAGSEPATWRRTELRSPVEAVPDVSQFPPLLPDRLLLLGRHVAQPHGVQLGLLLLQTHHGVLLLALQKARGTQKKQLQARTGDLPRGRSGSGNAGLSPESSRVILIDRKKTRPNNNKC